MEAEEEEEEEETTDDGPPDTTSLTVKQETAMLSLAQPLQQTQPQQTSHHIQTHKQFVLNNGLGINSMNTMNAMNAMNGMSAPQPVPATMSLSGFHSGTTMQSAMQSTMPSGMGMGFANTNTNSNAMSFPPPMSNGNGNGNVNGNANYLGGLGLPQFPSLHSHEQSQDGQSALTSPTSHTVPPPPSIPSMHPATAADIAQSSHETPDFAKVTSAMNVTPSVMAGGPPLTQM